MSDHLWYIYVLPRFPPYLSNRSKVKWLIPTAKEMHRKRSKTTTLWLPPIACQSCLDFFEPFISYVHLSCLHCQIFPGFISQLQSDFTALLTLGSLIIQPGRPNFKLVAGQDIFLMNVLSSLEVWEVSWPDLRLFPGHNTDFVLHLPPRVINKREKAFFLGHSEHVRVCVWTVFRLLFYFVWYQDFFILPDVFVSVSSTLTTSNARGLYLAHSHQNSECSWVIGLQYIDLVVTEIANTCWIS